MELAGNVAAHMLLDASAHKRNLGARYRCAAGVDGRTLEHDWMQLGHLEPQIVEPRRALAAQQRPEHHGLGISNDTDHPVARGPYTMAPLVFATMLLMTEQVLGRPNGDDVRAAFEE